MTPQTGKDAATRYQSLSLLGQGGMGQVFEATDQALHRPVAVKTMHAGWASDRGSALRFVREAQTAAKLDHPAIPPVHEVGLKGDGTPYLAMKLVRGQTLGELIDRLRKKDPIAHRQFSFTVRAQIMLRLCEAVHFAYQQGIVHRDLKPDNVMIGTFGEVQLMDWGVSYDLNLSGPSTTEKGFLGTPNYASPERFSDTANSLKPSSEVWSLGILMYELFTLKQAFPDAPLPQMMHAIGTKKLARPELIRNPIQGRCPKDFADIIRRATERDVARRIQTPEELGLAIGKALQDEAPVVCLCTGFKRSVGIMDRLVNRFGSGVVLLMGIWAISPFFLLVLILLRFR